MASRAYSTDLTLEPSETLKNPQKDIRMVHRWYKVSLVRVGLNGVSEEGSISCSF
jgi:hypothetical protein